MTSSARLLRSRSVLDLGRLQLLQPGIEALHEDAVVERRIVAAQARLGLLQLGPELAGLLDLAADLGEQGEEHGGLALGEMIRLASRNAQTLLGLRA